jgi:hypothetical protein
VVIILATGAMMVFGLWGTVSLTQEYQPEWLLPPEAEIAHWFRVKTHYYPGGGEPGFVMIKEIDIPNEFEVIEDLVSKLEATEANHNIDKVTPWHRAFSQTFGFLPNWFAGSQLQMFNFKQFHSSTNASSDHPSGYQP